MKNWIRIGNLYLNTGNIVDIALADDYVLIRTVDGRKIAVYMSEHARNALLRYLNHNAEIYLAEVRNENQ